MPGSRVSNRASKEVRVLSSPHTAYAANGPYEADDDDPGGCRHEKNGADLARMDLLSAYRRKRRQPCV